MLAQIDQVPQVGEAVADVQQQVGLGLYALSTTSTPRRASGKDGPSAGSTWHCFQAWLINPIRLPQPRISLKA
jgi:hypothetical protein